MRTAVGGGRNPRGAGTVVVSYDTKKTLVYIAEGGRLVRAISHLLVATAPKVSLAILVSLISARRVVVVCVSCMESQWLE